MNVFSNAHSMKAAAAAVLLICSGPGWSASNSYPVTTYGNGAGPKASSISASIGGVPDSNGQYRISDGLNILASITVAGEDIGTPGMFYAVAFYNGQKWMKTVAGQWANWDGDVDNLAPMREEAAMTAVETLDIYRGLSGLPGNFKVFVGYRNSNGTLSYNAVPIDFTVAMDEAAVLSGYVRIAHAAYEDSLTTALQLKAAVAELIANPSEAALDNAKAAWKKARIPYQQTEAYRFGNSVVDDWEGKVNAWPLDEGLIDYVDPGVYLSELGNEWAQANIIANNANIILGGETVNASQITPELLESLHEISGSEANVATGYHAIEFLLWGQDLNGTGPGAGERPFTDYVGGGGCTHGNCDRRADYLQAAVELLVQDLRYITDQWDPRGGTTGSNYATAFLAGSVQDGVRKMLYGIGSLSFGELAGERMKVALIANSPEDEHDCFSDNTHASYFYDALGIRNVYTGYYRRIDGTEISAPSLADLVRSQNPVINNALTGKINRSLDRLQQIVDQAESDQSFDQLIAPGNGQGAALVQAAIESLADQTLAIEAVAKALGITDLSPDTAGNEL